MNIGINIRNIEFESGGVKFSEGRGIQRRRRKLGNKDFQICGLFYAFVAVFNPKNHPLL